jgi:hypothetical protein
VLNANLCVSENILILKFYHYQFSLHQSYVKRDSEVMVQDLLTNGKRRFSLHVLYCGNYTIKQNNTTVITVTITKGLVILIKKSSSRLGR